MYLNVNLVDKFKGSIRRTHQIKVNLKVRTLNSFIVDALQLHKQMQTWKPELVRLSGSMVLPTNHKQLNFLLISWLLTPNKAFLSLHDEISSLLNVIMSPII